MKKIIAIFSIVLMAGCAFALADDNSNTPSSDQQAGQADQMNNPGISGTDTMNQTTTDTTTTVQKDQALRGSKSCVDHNGNTLKRGDVGFQDCLRSPDSKQQGGVASDSGMDKSTDKSADKSMDKSNQ
jgi:hypothetical protein